MAQSMQLLCVVALFASAEAGFWGWSAPGAGFFSPSLTPSAGFLSARNDKKTTEPAAPALMRRAEKQPQPVQPVEPVQPVQPMPIKGQRVTNRWKKEETIDAVTIIVTEKAVETPTTVVAPTATTVVAETATTVVAENVTTVVAEQKVEVPATAAPAAAPAAAAATVPKPSSRAARREVSLINSLFHDGEETTHCVSSCRYGEIRHTWHECLDMCVDNVFLRSTLAKMLPDEHHSVRDADHAETAITHGLALPDAETQRLLMKRKRSAEL